VFSEAITRGEATITYRYRPRKATLTAKLNAHGEVTYECLASTDDEATLAAQLNARSEAGVLMSCNHTR